MSTGSCQFQSRTSRVLRLLGPLQSPYNRGFPLAVLPLRWPSVKPQGLGSPLQATGHQCDLDWRVSKKYVFKTYVIGRDSSINLISNVYFGADCVGLATSATQASYASSDSSGLEPNIGCGAPGLLTTLLLVLLPILIIGGLDVPGAHGEVRGVSW